MTAQLTPRQMIAEALRDGRRWSRSFQVFKGVLSAMVRDGEVHRVAPDGGKACNMVELTGRGWKVYFGEDLMVTRLDNFAELLAQGFSPKDAGIELGLTKGQTAAALRTIKAQLGAQAV